MVCCYDNHDMIIQSCDNTRIPEEEDLGHRLTDVATDEAEVGAAVSSDWM